MTIAPERAAGSGRTGSPVPYGQIERAAASGRPAPASRDRSIDATRSALLLAVVALHSTMVGVSVGAHGPVMQNALENQAWFAPVSWIVQIMPLFFIIGGFSSITQWRNLSARNISAAAYLRGRIDRLVRPALVLVVVVGITLFAMTLLGVPPEIVAMAGFRIGQPLWFLGVYILCSALVPLMVRAHEGARYLTPLLLLGAVIGVDAMRMASGIQAVGLLNLLFVWLLVQQLGFWLADGHVDALSRRTRVGVLVTALGLLLALTIGPYPADMLVNLNPPTLCLVVLGVLQLMVFSLLRDRIGAWAVRRPARRLIEALGPRGMTVYIWHMPVLIALAALLLLLNSSAGVVLPEPLSPSWWGSRPLWLAVVGLSVVPVVAVFARCERGRRRPQNSSLKTEFTPRGVALDTLLGAGGVAVVLGAGFGVLPAFVAALLLGCALVGTGRIVTTVRARAAFEHRAARRRRSRGIHALELDRIR